MADLERTLRVVAAETGHLPDMLRNETRSYAFPWTEGVFRDCLAGPQTCWVAINSDEQIVGHAIISVAVAEAHLLNICISRDQQGSGYGRELLRFVLDGLRAEAAEVLFLEVRPSNRVACALYQSMGFREIGVRKDYYPAPLGREDALVLAFQFSAATESSSQKREIVGRSQRDPHENVGSSAT